MGIMGNMQSPTGWTAWDYANHICSLLQGIADSVRDDDAGSRMRMRSPFVINLDGNGNGQEIIKLRAGVTMNLLTYGFSISGGAGSGYIAFYHDEEQGTGLILVDDVTTVRSDNFNSDGHYVPANTQLLVVVRGGPANAILSGNVTAVRAVDGPGHPTLSGMS